MSPCIFSRRPDADPLLFRARRSDFANAAVSRTGKDFVRLRLLRVLAHDRFNVGELTGILWLAQWAWRGISGC